MSDKDLLDNKDSLDLSADNTIPSKEDISLQDMLATAITNTKASHDNAMEKVHGGNNTNSQHADGNNHTTNHSERPKQANSQRKSQNNGSNPNRQQGDAHRSPQNQNQRKPRPDGANSNRKQGDAHRSPQNQNQRKPRPDGANPNRPHGEAHRSPQNQNQRKPRLDGAKPRTNNSNQQKPNSQAGKQYTKAISQKPQDVKNNVDKKPVAKKKSRFKNWPKKKKLIFISGVLFLVLFIIFLVLYGKFHGYVNLLNIYKGDTDSSYVVKKDTDSSDTVDPEEEEARLRAELEKNASSIMSQDGVTNILLIGEDLRDTTEGSRGNTDVMMMISINDNTKQITMSSFMRDMYIFIPGWYSTKLNAAYAFDGPELLKTTIQKNFGVNIDRYAIVNFESFIDIVETIGGITVDVDEDELDALSAPMSEQNRILGNDKGTDYLTESGVQLLNGNQALGYARIRYGCGDDFGRTARQREVISEMIKEAKGLSLSELDKLVTKVASKLTTDITENEISGLLLKAFDYMDYEVQQLQIPATDTFSGEIIDGLDCLQVDLTANATLLQQTIFGSSVIGDDSSDDTSTDDTNNGDIVGYDDNGVPIYNTY